MRLNLEQEIKSVSIDDKRYPKSLKRIDDPPKVLYYRGELPFRPAAGGAEGPVCFAIVGTRRASDYGKEIAFSFAKQLVQAGLTIVSGMARGIDTFAHKGALDIVGVGSPQTAETRPPQSVRTIAVLGTGLNEKVIYPQENLGLAKKILEAGGCLISEYPSDYPGSPYTFPQRNRIIAAISLGVLVVEAKFGSGALITANLAKKQGEKVFAIPGSIYSKNSQGCHWLIKQGAILVDKPEDILKGLKIKSLSLLPRRPAGGGVEVEVERAEQKILASLQQGSLHIDKIIATTKLPAQQVSSILSIMEIEGKVKNLGGNVFALIR